MPFIKEDESIEVNMGHGDIEVMPGLLDQEEVIGAVCFKEKVFTPIGTVEDHIPAVARELSETPVRLTFTKIESIDVVIRSLESAKRYMQNGIVD